MIARSASSRRLAIARARTTPPTSGDTTIRLSVPCARQMSPSSTGDAYTLSTGMSKNPWIWSACRSTVSTRSVPTRAEHVRRHLRRDRHARRTRPAILARVAEIRHHRGDAGRRGALERVDQHQQFHQVSALGAHVGCTHEHVVAAHVFLDLDLHFAVGKRARPAPCPGGCPVPCTRPRPAAGWRCP